MPRSNLWSKKKCHAAGETLVRKMAIKNKISGKHAYIKID